MRTLCRRVTAVCSIATAAVAVAVASAAAATRPTIFHRPRIHAAKPSPSALGWASTNWSGYAVTGGPYNSVTSRWVVPAAAPSHKSTFSANWTGIDGFNNSSLIQTGTESDYYQKAAHYDAWWEILPAPETVIPSLTVKPGDIITATVAKVSGSTWKITITDGSHSYSTTQTYSGPQTSAEWIEEAPTVGGHVATLANYGHTTFDPGTVNGHNPLLTSSDGGLMVQKNHAVSTPSIPDADTDGFNAAYGAAAPAPPAS